MDIWQTPIPFPCPCGLWMLPKKHRWYSWFWSNLPKWLPKPLPIGNSTFRPIKTKPPSFRSSPCVRLLMALLFFFIGSSFFSNRDKIRHLRQKRDVITVIPRRNGIFRSRKPLARTRRASPSSRLKESYFFDGAEMSRCSLRSLLFTRAPENLSVVPVITQTTIDRYTTIIHIFTT